MKIKEIAVTVLIGNSDDKLSQWDWSAYCERTHDIIKRYANHIHFSGFSVGNAKWQNAAFVFVMDSDHFQELGEYLRIVKDQFGQESIAVVYGPTEFIR
jgi:hypothetical protein